VGGERIRFSPTILPPYARRTKSLEVLIPILYLKGISTGDFEEALGALLGKDAGGLSASTIARLKEAWVDEHVRWRDRDLSAKRYVYVWADGIYVQARLEQRVADLLECSLSRDRRVARPASGNLVEVRILHLQRHRAPPRARHNGATPSR